MAAAAATAPLHHGGRPACWGVPARCTVAHVPFHAHRPPTTNRHAGGDRKGAAVVYMAPIPPTQSHRLHLLTVTADGRRVYWAAASSRYGTDRELCSAAVFWFAAPAASRCGADRTCFLRGSLPVFLWCCAAC